MVLTKDSYSYGLWKQLPPELPMFMNIYFFNVTNPEEVAANTEKPKIIEVGPYVYQEFHLKVNETWNANNDTITFMQSKWWKFKPERSAGSEDDIITNINIIAIVSTLLISKLELFSMDFNFSVCHRICQKAA